MRRLALLPFLLVVLAGCDEADNIYPPEGCKGHGGIAHPFGEDATDEKVPFACKDGTVGWVSL